MFKVPWPFLTSILTILMFLTLGWNFAYAAMPPLNFTVNMSETVIVNTTGGTPTIALTVDDKPRFATYASGTGTNALTFTYAPTVGDVDLDGITITSPYNIILNSGTIKDAAGNNASLSFTPPVTTGVKVNYPSLSMDFVYDADGRYTLNGNPHDTLSTFLTDASGSFTRASIGTYFDSTGTLQTATSNTPRFDYDPTSHIAKGILIEEQRTNLFLQSENISNSSWTKGNATITSNSTTAPDAANTAGKIVENTAASSVHSISQAASSGSANAYYTFSFFAKAAERNSIQVWLMGASSANRSYANFILTGSGSYSNSGVTGTMTTGSFSISKIGTTGWYKCSISGKTGASETGIRVSVSLLDSTPATVYTGDGASGLYVWGLQLEQAAFPTSYIPTTSATVTRVGDNLVIPTGSWYSSAFGTLMSQSILPYVGGQLYPGTMAIDDGTAANSIHLFISDAATDGKASEIFNGGTAQFSTYGAAYTAGSTFKQAVYYNSNFARASMDGTLGPLDTSITVPTVNTLHIGRRRGGVEPLNGWIQKAKYYPIQVTDTQLQLLTQ